MTWRWWMLAAVGLLAGGCGRTGLDLGGDWDGFVTDVGPDGSLPDVRPDGGTDGPPPPPGGATDVPPPPDGAIDTAPPPPDGTDGGRPDGGWDGDRPDRWDGDRPDRWDGGGTDGVGPDGSTDGGGCDPAGCAMICSMTGSGSGTCVGDVCVCGTGPDGGTSDGGTTDGGLPPPPPDGGGDGSAPDFGRDSGRDVMWDGDRETRDGLRETRDGLRDFGRDSGVADSTADSSLACDPAACFEDCRAVGYTGGYCDPSGACSCF